MASTIEFNVDRLLGRLNILESTQIRYASKRSLTRFGYEASQHLGLQMAGRFENPVKYTLSSPRYDRNITEDGNTLSLRLYINPDGSKGSAPASYIYPTDAGSSDNTAYATRFGVGLRKSSITIKFPVPYKQGMKVERNSHGNMKPSQYHSVLEALKGGSPTIFALPAGNPPSTGRRNSSSSGRDLPPGIYQREGRTAYLLFALLDEPPKVRVAFDFYGISQRLAQQRLPKLLREELGKALRG